MNKQPPFEAPPVVKPRCCGEELPVGYAKPPPPTPEPYRLRMKPPVLFIVKAASDPTDL